MSRFRIPEVLATIASTTITTRFEEHKIDILDKFVKF